MECQFEGHQLSPHLLVCDGVEQKGILDEVGAEHVQELVIPAERNGALKYSALFWPAGNEQRPRTHSSRLEQNNDLSRQASSLRQHYVFTIKLCDEASCAFNESHNKVTAQNGGIYVRKLT